MRHNSVDSNPKLIKALVDCQVWVEILEFTKFNCFLKIPIGEVECR